MRFLTSRVLQAFRRHSSGVTLIELIVTIGIFGAVTTVLLGSFLTIFSVREQTTVSQEANDDVRVILDGIEREIQAGNNITASSSAISFVVSSRGDAAPYPVKYRLSGDAIQKAVGNNAVSGDPCNYDTTSMAFADEDDCWLPVTGDNVEISVLNFSIEAPEAEQAQTSPLVTLSLVGEVLDSAGKASPLTYSTSITPRNRVTVSDVEQTLGVGDPIVTLENISVYPPGTCDISRDLYQPIDAPALPPDGFGDTFYTDCLEVNLEFRVDTGNSGLHSLRYVNTTSGNGALEQGTGQMGADIAVIFNEDADRLVLVPGSNNIVRVRTENLFGNSVEQEFYVRQVVFTDAPPGPVRNLTATPGACGSGSITLNWQAPTVVAGTAGAATMYEVTGGGSILYFGPATSYTHTGITNPSVDYVVRAYNLGGYGPITAVTSNAPAPCAVAPTVDVVASDATLILGEQAFLTWTSTDTDSCMASGAWSGGRSVNGGPESTGLLGLGIYIFTLTCERGGTTAVDSVTISVVNGIGVPTVNLDATDVSLTWNQPAFLVWTSTNADSCTAGGDWSGGKALNGGPESTGPLAIGTYTFTLTCERGGISSSDSVTVDVTAGTVCQTGTYYERWYKDQTSGTCPDVWGLPALEAGCVNPVGGNLTPSCDPVLNAGDYCVQRVADSCSTGTFNRGKITCCKPGPVMPPCPYIADANTVVYHLVTSKLLSDYYLRASTTFNLSVPAGTYTVRAAAWDGYLTRPASILGQSQERYFIELMDGDVVRNTTGPTQDLADGVVEAFDERIVASGMVVPPGIDKLVTRHFAYPSPDANSVQPVCVAFTRELPPGDCGTANANSYYTATAANLAGLCDVGSPSPASLSGVGPWFWQCIGSPNASCSAVQKQDAVCGSADGGTYADATAVNNDGLCTVGNASPSSVSGSGPWNWSCLGINGGAPASCTADAGIMTPVVQAGCFADTPDWDTAQDSCYNNYCFDGPTVSASFLGTDAHRIHFSVGNTTANKPGQGDAHIFADPTNWSVSWSGGCTVEGRQEWCSVARTGFIPDMTVTATVTHLPTGTVLPPFNISGSNEISFMDPGPPVQNCP